MEQGHGTALRILCWELHCFFARLGKGDSPKQGPSSFYHCVFMQAPFYLFWMSQVSSSRKNSSKPRTAGKYPPEGDDSFSWDRVVTVVTRLVNLSLFSLSVLYTWTQTGRHSPCMCYSIKASFCFYSPHASVYPTCSEKASAFN